MIASDLLKLGVPVAIAASGATYVATSSDSEETEKKVIELEEKLDASNKTIDGYIYKLKKAENEIVILKSKKK